MKLRAVGSVLLVWLLAACAGGTLPSFLLPDGSQPTSGPTSNEGAAEGTWSGTITRTYRHTVATSAVGLTTSDTNTYTAKVRISSTWVSIGGWTLAGDADITGTWKSESTEDYPNGHCHKHYTDDASAADTKPLKGGLEVRDGRYQFYVNVPAIEGNDTSVRDDSGCGGTNTTETNTWPVAFVYINGSGDVTDPNHITGSKTTPVDNGEDTNTWDLTRSP